MALTLQGIEALAPDQGALTAAGKLRKPSQWLQLAHDAGTSTLWGECHGSGANPYRVVADSADHGYKCSCPSRKFPCKHALALMWMFVEAPERFSPASPVDWVADWLGRRRRPAQHVGGGDDVTTAAPAGRSIRQADAASGDGADADQAAPDDAARRRHAASASRRRAQTDLAVAQGLDDLQQWIGDQLRSGMATFVADAPARCRRIASRLVDAKAANLASRLDELPARLLGLPPPLRLQAAMHELGQLVVLIQAWRAHADDADARSAVMQSPARDAVLSDPHVRHVPGPWQVLATEIETRRDGLVGHATWLSHVHVPQQFALLQDFFPASAGRRSPAFSAGQIVEGTVSFLPGRYPLRGVLGPAPASPAETHAAHGGPPELAVSADPLAPHRRHLSGVPWALSTPLQLASGRIGRDHDGQDWWLFTDSAASLPLQPVDPDAAWRGLALKGGAVIWDGWRARVLAVQTLHGPAYLQR